ncbi:MAG: hypothetical protein OXT71_16240 [Acidobacteriota bacterium]|nr:hypothetical protein [Acidobacteriota bacterium]
METGDSQERKRRGEYRYSGWLLLLVGLLLLASFYYTFDLWPVKLLLTLFLLSAAGFLLWRAGRLSKG